MEKSTEMSPQTLAFTWLKRNPITTDKLSREKHHPWNKRKIIRKHQFDFNGIKRAFSESSILQGLWEKWMFRKRQVRGPATLVMWFSLWAYVISKFGYVVT